MLLLLLLHIFIRKIIYQNRIENVIQTITLDSLCIKMSNLSMKKYNSYLIIYCLCKIINSTNRFHNNLHSLNS